MLSISVNQNHGEEKKNYSSLYDPQISGSSYPLLNSVNIYIFKTILIQKSLFDSVKYKFKSKINIWCWILILELA